MFDTHRLSLGGVNTHGYANNCGVKQGSHFYWYLIIVRTCIFVILNYNYMVAIAKLAASLVTEYEQQAKQAQKNSINCFVNTKTLNMRFCGYCRHVLSDPYSSTLPLHCPVRETHRERTYSFLTSCVPYLKFYCLVVHS